MGDVKKRTISIEIEDRPNSGVRVKTSIDPEIDGKSFFFFNLGKFHNMTDVDFTSMSILLTVRRELNLAAGLDDTSIGDIAKGWDT